MMDDNAQMMIMEAVLSAVIILIALIFLYQLSPTSTVSNTYTNDLKIKGDNALQSLYNNEVSEDGVPGDFPKGKLTYYLITNDYQSLVSSNLKNMLPPTTIFNIYISNGTTTVLWCNSSLGNSTPLKLIEPITISHYMVSIHPDFLTEFDTLYKNDGKSALYNTFATYEGSTYDVILEMCNI